MPTIGVSTHHKLPATLVPHGSCQKFSKYFAKGETKPLRRCLLLVEGTLGPPASLQGPVVVLSCMLDNRKSVPRVFRWSQAARDLVRADLSASGPQLHHLIDDLVRESGNPRDACLRFARQMGIKSKRVYRRWTIKERKNLEHLLELYPVRTVAIKLRRTIPEVRGMMHRLGIGAKMRKESLSLYTLARLLHKRPAIIHKWIETKALMAENEGTEAVPRYVISQENLARFCKEHSELIAGARVNPERIEFIFEYVFPHSHSELLAVRESKREQAAYEAQMRQSDTDWDNLDEQEIDLPISTVAIPKGPDDVNPSFES